MMRAVQSTEEFFEDFAMPRYPQLKRRYFASDLHRALPLEERLELLVYATVAGNWALARRIKADIDSAAKREARAARAAEDLDAFHARVQRHLGGAPALH